MVKTQEVTVTEVDLTEQDAGTEIILVTEKHGSTYTVKITSESKTPGKAPAATIVGGTDVTEESEVHSIGSDSGGNYEPNYLAEGTLLKAHVTIGDKEKMVITSPITSITIRTPE